MFLSQFASTRARSFALLATLLAFGGIFGSVAPIASAAPAQPAHPATVVRALDAYPCETTTFLELESSAQTFVRLTEQETLQAALWVEVDPTRSNLYCGQVQAEGVDTLEAGCVTFEGAVNEIYSPYADVSLFSVFHCTHTTYDLWGSVTALTCASGQKLVTPAYVKEYTDTVDSPLYTC